MSNKIVLDASALLCLLNDEPGADRVAEVLTRSVIGATNLAEVVSKLRERGLSLVEVREALGGLHLDVRPLSQAQAMLIGDLRPATRALGLSLGDRGVTPVFHPAATRDRPLLSRRSACEATDGFKPVRCVSSWAANAVGVA